MDNIFVTVGIPLYNAEKFIKIAIQSVLLQSHSNFELIITDDGSSDRSVEIVKSFSDQRIILLSDGMNKGISYRLNQQIDLAKGKYFFRMDADDIMFPSRLEEQISCMEQNPEADVVGSSAVIIDNNNYIIGIREGIVPQDIAQAVKSSVFIHPTVCGKLSWFKEFKYDGLMNGAEDYDLWLRAWETSIFKISNEPLLFYRDPLEFKIKTYVDRLKKQRIKLRSNKVFKNRIILKNKILFISYLKTIAAKTLHFLGKDQFLISRRNSQMIVQDEKQYQNILLQILNKNHENI